MGFGFEIEFELYDQFGDLIKAETTVNLSFNDTVLGYSSITTTEGTGKFSLSYNNFGFLQVEASVSTFATETVVIEVVKSKMEIVISQTPTQIDSSFDITITVYDNEVVNINTVNSLFSISISVSPLCIFSCSGPIDVVSGQAIFSACKFSTSGIFKLTFTSNSLDPVTKGPYLIKDPSMASILLLGPLKESTFISFTITVKLLDASGVELVNPSASLRISSSFDLTGSLIVLGSSAVVDLQYYCVSTGTNTISVQASDLTKSIIIDIVQNALKFDTFSIIPTQTSSLFNVIIGVYNYDFTKRADLYGDFVISLALDATGTLTGSVIENEASGLVTFTGLKIETKGIYYLKADCSKATQATSQELIIGILVIKSHTVNINPNPVSICEEFIVSVTIFDQFSVLYINSATVTINSDCAFFDNLVQTTTNGIQEFSLYSSVIALCQLTVTTSYALTESSNSISSTYSVEFIQSKLKFEVSPPTNLYTTEEFSLKICVYKFNLASINSKYCSLSLVISLQNSELITGTTSRTTTNGCSEFMNLKITLPVSTSVIASSPGFDSVTSSITTTALTIQITATDLTITAFFDTTITVTVLDQSNSICTEALALSINIPDSSYSESSANIETGVLTIPVYFLVSGSKQVAASTLGYSAEFTITVRKAILKLIDFPATFSYNQAFDIKIGVFDYLGTIQETLKGSHTVNLNIKDSSNFDVILSSSTLLGEAKFQNIKISTKQNVNVLASCNDMETVSGSLDYVAASIIILELLGPNEELYTKVLYDFQVSVTNQLLLSQVLVEGAKVSFYVNDQVYSETLTNSEGISSFLLVFNQSGPYSLKFEYDSVLLGNDFIVENSENTEKLCYIAQDKNNCSKCVENARLLNGTCQCYTGSSYSIITRICECPLGQKPKKYVCESCGFYFKASEISSEFDKDYKKIFINFGRPVNIKNLKTCNNIISGPEGLLRISKKCKWISLQILSVELEAYPSIQNPQIILNNINVQALDTICSYDREDLIIDIVKKYEVPKPSADINAPDFYSITCSKLPLQISASFKSTVVSYAWKSSIQPINDQVLDLISSTISDTIEIPKSLLSVSVIKLELTVTFNNLNTWATSSKEIIVENKNHLTVELNVKSFNQIKKSNAVYLVASVKQACGQSEKFSYKWTGSGISLDEYIQSNRKDMLQIPGGVLDSGKQYSFQVDVNEGSATGKAMAVYEVLSSDLVIALTRSSGEITTKKDFNVGCTVIDPDNKDSKISTEWYCVETKGVCTDSRGKSIITTSKDCNLIISKGLLRSRATYILTVKASTSQKTQYLTIEVKVNPNIEGVSEVSFPSTKINSDYINNLIPKITYSGFLTFTWKLSGGEYLTDNLISTNSFIGIPEFTLKQGVNYRLELDITSDHFKETLKIYGELISNIGPVCEGLKYAQGDYETFLSAEGCVDGDDEDYPLTFQFGFSDKKNKVRWVNEPIGINTYSHDLPSNAVKAYVRVFDTFDTSNTYSTEISRRDRYLQDYLLQIMQKVRNPSNVPSTVMEYKDLELDYASFTYLFSSFYSYFITLPSTRSNIELFIDCLEGILTHSQWVSDEILNNSTRIAIHILEGLNQRVLPEICENQFLAFQEYLSRIDKDLLLDLLILVGEKLIIDTVPNTAYKYSAFFSFIKLRKIAGSYIGSQVTEGNLTVEFPKNFDIDETFVFDTFFSLQITDDSFIIHFLVSGSGIYENYTLDIYDFENYGMDVKNPLLFTIANTYQFNDATCKESKTNDSSNCQIEKVNKTHVVMSLYKQGSFTIEKGSRNCSLTRTPISVSAVLFGFFICFGILFFIRDKNNVPTPRDTFAFSVLYSLTSIFISQEHPSRTCSVLRMCSKLLLILASIGLTYSSTVPNQIYSQFAFFNFHQLGRGLFSLAACQIHTIIINIFMVIGKKQRRKSFQFVEIIMLILVSIVSILAISLVCVLVCPEDVTDWLINFAIFGTADVVLLELILGKIISTICNLKSKDKNNATVIPLGKSISISDKFPLNDTWHFSPRAIQSTISNEKNL